MKCKHCGKEIAAGSLRCPGCGMDYTVNAGQQNTPIWVRLMLGFCSLVLVFLISAGWTGGSYFASGEGDITHRKSYTVSERELQRKQQWQVAFMGDDALTNGQLQVYYWTEVYDFITNYSYYLVAVNLDLTQPLDQQVMDPNNKTLRYLLGEVEENMTWEQYFLQGALHRWRSNQALAQVARAQGYEMDGESRRKLEALPAQLEKDAQKAGFATVDEYLQDSMGPGCTQADYMDYMETYYLGYSYFASLYEAIDPTQAELDAYFAKNEASLKEYGITKNMGHTVNVRHILITPGGEIPDQQEEYTEQQWSACFTRAQAVLDAFLAGDRSEDSFALLALRYSEDSVENVTAGGLFQYVQEGEMEGEFNTWCFAEGREPGQYGIVKTSYGYHIMYFVSAEEMWVTQTRSLYIREESQKIVSGALDSHPVRVEYGRIALGRVKLM